MPPPVEDDDVGEVVDVLEMFPAVADAAVDNASRGAK
jgi:hypothetical protein